MTNQANTAKLRTLLTIAGPDDISTRWVVRTVWFKGGDHLAETMEHETAPFKSKAEAENWLAHA